MILRSTLPGCIVLAAAFTFFHGAEQPALGQTKRQKAVVTAARSISRALQEGRIRQALGRAEKAVRQHPESGRLRTRRAQARLCLALQLDRDLSLALSEAALDRSLETALRFLRETGLDAVTKRGGEPLSALKEEQFRQLLQYVESDEVKGFRSAARKRIARALPLAEQRTSALAGAFDDLREAGRLGDRSAEARLTELWADVVVLLWRIDLQRLPGRARVPQQGSERSPSPSSSFFTQLGINLRRTMQPFEGVTVDSVLDNARALAQDRSDDPRALAGAADVISVLLHVGKLPRPLLRYSKQALDHGYTDNPERNVRALSAESRAQAKRLYDKAPPQAKAGTDPESIALALYEQALALDTEGELPFLPLRVYLLIRAFEPDRAEQLLKQAERGANEDDGVIDLERARDAFLLRGDKDEGRRHLRSAVKHRRFGRSYLVGVPAPLGASFRRYQRLQAHVPKGWPGYHWLFSMLSREVRSAGSPSRKMDVATLGVKLADLMVKAPDYADRTVAVSAKTNVLTQLLKHPEGLSASQQARLRLFLQQHRDAHRQFPRERVTLVVTAAGIGYGERPSLFPSKLTDATGYVLVVMPSQGVGLMHIRK